MSKLESPRKNGSTIPTSTGDETKIWLYTDITIVCLLIIGVWSLASLPIILYHIPKSEISSNTSGTMNTSGRDTLCSPPLRYAKPDGICLKELANILRSSNCLPHPERYLSVVRNEEDTATKLINGLASLGASAECLSKAAPFLCLHLFGLCTESGVSIQPTSNQCAIIRDTTCQQQWIFLEKLDIGIPDCELFHSEFLSCPGLNDSLPTNGTTTANMLDLKEEHLNGTTRSVLECIGDFYQEKGSNYCTRSCYKLVQFLGNELITYAFTVVLYGVSFLLAAVIIIISGIAHKRMFIFPAVFIVYMIIDYMILLSFTLLGAMDRGKLYCTSRSLIKSLTEVNPFCVIYGISVTYTLGQMSLWWIFHTTTLFWNVMFPFHARVYEMSGKNKYIHITCIIVGILLPVVPIITILADTAVGIQKQYRNSTSQLRNSLFLSEGLGLGSLGLIPNLCYVTNSAAVFYSLILMLDFISVCGCTMIIIIFWSVHKLYIKRKQVQKKFNVIINGKTRPQFTFGLAEKKLLIVLCYSMIMSVIVLTILAFETRVNSVQIKNFQVFLFCEQGSHNSSNPCTQYYNDRIGFIIPNVLVTIIFSLFPIVNLLHAVNIQELKEFWRKCPCMMVKKH